MKKYNLLDFTKGWFVGNFSDNSQIYTTNNAELAIKKYKKGDKEKKHYHKLATEITVIISGKVKMNNYIFSDNDIILIDPDEETDFECLEDTTTCVFKSVSGILDKFEK